MPYPTHSFRLAQSSRRRSCSGGFGFGFDLDLLTWTWVRTLPIPGRLNINMYTYKNQTLKNRKLKRKRKQKRNGWGHLRGGASRPSRRLPCFRFCFRFRFNFRFFKFLFLYVYVLIFNRPVNEYPCLDFRHGLAQSWKIADQHGKGSRAEQSTRACKYWAIEY